MTHSMCFWPLIRQIQTAPFWVFLVCYNTHACRYCGSVSSISLLELSIHVVIETAAPVWAELNCPALAARLFADKTFIRSLLDQRGRGSFLPLGDNWPTHTVGQDGSERGTRADLMMHTHTMESDSAGMSYINNRTRTHKVRQKITSPLI